MPSPNTTTFFNTGSVSLPAKPSEAAGNLLTALMGELQRFTALQQATDKGKAEGKTPKEGTSEALTGLTAAYETIMRLVKAPNPMLQLSASEATAFAAKLVTAVLADPTGITATAAIGELVQKSLADEGPKSQNTLTKST
jgi:hypothetical protein